MFSMIIYYEENFLWKIANKIGRPLRVDLTTFDQCDHGLFCEGLCGS